MSVKNYVSGGAEQIDILIC